MIVTLLALAVAAGLAVALWQRRGRRTGWWWAGAAAAGAAAVLLAWAVRHDKESQKFVTALALPAGLAWAALGALTGLLWRRRQAAPACLAALAFAAYTAAGNQWLGNWLMATLEREVPAAPAEGPRRPRALPSTRSSSSAAAPTSARTASRSWAGPATASPPPSRPTGRAARAGW
jgi:hypothetical protein